MRGLMPARITLGTALLVVLAGCKSTALRLSRSPSKRLPPPTPPP